MRFLETGQRQDGSVRAALTGLMHCNSPWTCPWCARAQQVKDAITLHTCNLGFRDQHPGGQVYMLTLTARHHAGVNLRGLRKALAKAYQKTQTGKAVASMRKRFGVLSGLRRVEVNRGGSGWHPHIHALLFCHGKLTPQELESLKEWWFVHFGKTVAKEGFERPSKRDGICITVADKKGQYLAKMGLMELAGDQEKVGRCPSCSKYTETTWRKGARLCRECGSETSRTMWQILDDINAHGHAKDRETFMTFYREIRGARRLTYSRWKGGIDLRRFYLPAEQAPLPAPTREIIGMSNSAFRKLKPDQVADLFEACESSHRHGIEAILGDDMPPVAIDRKTDDALPHDAWDELNYQERADVLERQPRRKYGLVKLSTTPLLEPPYVRGEKPIDHTPLEVRTRSAALQRMEYTEAIV